MVFPLLLIPTVIPVIPLDLTLPVFLSDLPHVLIPTVIPALAADLTLPAFLLGPPSLCSSLPFPSL